MGSSAQAKASVPPSQTAATAHKEKSELRFLSSETSLNNESLPNDDLGAGDVSTQIHYATHLGHQLGHFQAGHRHTSPIQLKANYAVPIQRQGYGYEDEEQMMSVWHDESVGMTSPDAPMSFPISSSSSHSAAESNFRQWAGMTSPDAPMSIAVPAGASTTGGSRLRANSNDQQIGDSSFDNLNESISHTVSSNAWDYAGNANNLMSSSTSFTQSLGDAVLFGTINPGMSPIADSLWNVNRADDLIGLAGTANQHGVASRAGRVVSGLGTAASTLGLAMGGVNAYDAYQRGDTGGIVQGTSDATASAIGFAGPVGGAFSGGYASGQLLDRGIDWVGDAITGDESVDHSISGWLGEVLYDIFGPGDEMPLTRRRGIQ